MLKKKTEDNQIRMFLSMEDMLDQKHGLYILSKEVNWQLFEDAFTPLYCEDNGRPPKPIRMMVGLTILKHIRNISDESVVEQWSENIYYQYFCSELVHFRHRIGESGIELIFKESIRINGEDSEDPNASADTTVQEKNITYPTDNKLHRKIIKKCKAISEKEGLPIRQSYTRKLKELGIDQHFRNHPKNKGKAKRADKKVKTIAGRLVRELERNLSPSSIYQTDLELFKKILSQKKSDNNKIYSLHEPETQCIAKGKEHKKYEFGNKVSVIYTQKTGVLIGAMGFRNEYDGHTLEPALKQVSRLLDKSTLKTVTADRGYKGLDKINGIGVLTPKPFNDKKQSKYQQNKLKKKYLKRAGIEPIIGHLKTDHRVGRNFYKGIFGDNINIMLAAAAFNFKRMMRKWKTSFLTLFQAFIQEVFLAIVILFTTKLSQMKEKMAF